MAEAPTRLGGPRSCAASAGPNGENLEVADDYAEEMDQLSKEFAEVFEGVGDEIVIKGDGDERGEDQQEHWRRKARQMLDPKLPSESEVKEHYLSGHMPYRNWCHHCVRGRGREREHRKRDGHEQGLPEYHMDYCFPGDECDQRLTVLVVVERYSKMKKAVVVPSKGSTGSYAARMVIELIRERRGNDRDIIVKTDQ